MDGLKPDRRGVIYRLIWAVSSRLVFGVFRRLPSFVCFAKLLQYLEPHVYRSLAHRTSHGIYDSVLALITP